MTPPEDPSTRSSFMPDVVCQIETQSDQVICT